MHKAVTATGDELLAGDAQYVSSHEGGGAYLAYPSAKVPRFLIPVGDATGIRFVVDMLSADRGFLGALLRTTVRLPGGVWLVQRILFRETIIAPHD